MFLLVLGVITNLNTIITNSLTLAGYKLAATISGIAIGAVAIIMFVIQVVYSIRWKQHE